MDLNDILSGRATTQPPPPAPSEGGPFRTMQATIMCSGCHVRVPDATTVMTPNGPRCVNCQRVAREAVASVQYDYSLAYNDEAAARERRNYWIMRGIVLFVISVCAIGFRLAMHSQQEQERRDLERRGLILDDSTP